jgi:hypothetical protein
MMGKYHKAIEESYSKKAVRVSECKTEALDKIDTRKTFGDGSGCKCLFDVIVQPANLLEAAGKSGSDECVKRGKRVYCY